MKQALIYPEFVKLSFMPCSNSVGDYENKRALGQNVKIWLTKITQVSVYSDFQAGWQFFLDSTEHFCLPAQRPITLDFSTQPVHPLHRRVAVFSDLPVQPGPSTAARLTLFAAEETSPVCSSPPSFRSSLLNHRQSFLACPFLVNPFFPFVQMSELHPSYSAGPCHPPS